MAAPPTMKPYFTTNCKLLINFPSKSPFPLLTNTTIFNKTKNTTAAATTTTTATIAGNDTKKKKKKKWDVKGTSLRRKVRTIIRSTLAKSKYFSSKTRDDKVHNNGDESKELEDDKNQSVFKVGLPSLARVPSRGLNGLRKIGRVMSMRKDDAHHVEEGDELCKKRILMGNKCRPLNKSGALRYDNNGVLVPEYLLSPCKF